jgi:hypothetical protein
VRQTVHSAASDLSADQFMMGVLLWTSWLQFMRYDEGVGDWPIAGVYFTSYMYVWGGECRIFKKIIMLMVTRVVVTLTSSPAIKQGLC